MNALRTIEIDLDIHKAIERERRSFSETPNDVLKRLLKLTATVPQQAATKTATKQRAWAGDGVTLPHGTLVKMEYNGRCHEGEIVDGKCIVEGKTFDSPSGAASGVGVTKRGKTTRLDGWKYWFVRLPGDTSWTLSGSLRPPRAYTATVTDEELFE